MKKLIAAALLMIYLFNLGGYLAVHQYMVYRSDKFYNEQTKKGLYDIFDVSEIKVPFRSTGMKVEKYFRQVSGSVHFQQATYNYVAIQVTKDTLHLLCLPNYETTTFITHNVIRVPGIKDIAVPKKDHVPFAGILLPPGFIFAFHYAPAKPPVLGLIKNCTAYQCVLVNRHTDIPTKPPEKPC